MTIANSSSARKAGFKVNNEAVSDAAALSMAKIGCRTLYFALPPLAWHFAGAGVAVTSDGISPVITLPNANSGNLYTSFQLPAEWESASMVLSVYWKTSTVSGDVKFTAAVACLGDGATTAAEQTVSATTTVSATANTLNKSEIAVATTGFAANGLVGINILRDPADAADTLAADISFVSAVLEFTGRG